MHFFSFTIPKKSGFFFTKLKIRLSQLPKFRCVHGKIRVLEMFVLGMFIKVRFYL